MSLKGKTIAVTGASGMIGVYICRSLLRSGAHVVGVVRNPSKASFLVQEGVEFRQADLSNVDALTEAFRGCDAVVSNAAMYVSSKTMSNWNEHEKVNLDGTRNVYNATARAGIKRIIHMSSFAIYKFSIVREINEQSPQLNGQKRQGGAYRATKQMSEALGWTLALEMDISMTALRPSAVYGARDSNTLGPIQKMLNFRILPLPSISFPFVYAGDVANAVTVALTNDATSGQAYNICGDHLQFSDFLKSLNQITGKDCKIISLEMPISIKADISKAAHDLEFHNRLFSDAFKEIFSDFSVM